MVVIGLMLSTGLAATVSAAPEEDPLDRIKLEQGTTTEFGGGDFVAVNMTNGDNAAWFGVVYGTPEHPNSPTLVGAYVRYLGGATVSDENGGMMISAVPIPVLTVFAQKLDSLIEFNDTGLPNGQGGRYGAGNGVFDFYGNRSLGNFGLWAVEPVYKIVDLKEAAWSVGEIYMADDAMNGTRKYEFALSATDLRYTKIWDDRPATNPDGSRPGTVEDGVVSKVEFVFHIDASATKMEAAVPWYEVKIDGNNNIVSSAEVEAKNYTGISVNAAFKYDHIIEGWDYTARSSSSRLMLENIVLMGTFIPDIVQRWMDSQFIDSQIPDGAGTVHYQASGSDVESTVLPDRSTQVAKNKIEYRDNWQRIGKLTWVSNVTIDGQEDRMYYQVHAGDSIQKIRDFQQPVDGEVRGIAVIGGYIYPAGEDIYHDPTFEAGTFQLSIIGDIDPAVVFLLLFGVAVVCGLSLVTVLVLRDRSRRRNENHRYQVPPGFQR
jgi:hypothetical protein